MLIAEHSTVAADRLLASVTVVVKLRLMFSAHFFSSIVAVGSVVLQGLNCVGYFLKDSEVYELRDSKGSSTMRALLSRFLKPLSKTLSASELRARGTHRSILNRAETNKTTEDFIEIRFA